MRRLRALALAALAVSLAAPSTAPAAAPAVTPPDIDGHLQALAGIAAANGGNRASGLPGADASAQYLADQLTAMGWQTRLQPVTFPFMVERSAPVLHDLQHGRDFVTARGSASADATGRVRTLLGQRCTARNFRKIRRGEIVILPFTRCTPRQASQRVKARGGVAIVADNGPATFPLRATLAGRIEVPILLTRTTSAVRLSKVRTPVRVKVDAVNERRTANNVIAELPGSSKVVMAGGHLDSAPESPGINDNGSGMAALLEVAERLRSEPRKATVRLGFWTAEEYGLFGSAAYVKALSRSERRRLRGYLNFDMVGSPNGVVEVYDSDDALERLLRRTFTGREGETDLSAASDHAAFLAAGIPVGGIYTGSLETRRGRARDRCYHRPCDGVQNADRAMAAKIATAAERALASLAK